MGELELGTTLLWGPRQVARVLCPDASSFCRLTGWMACHCSRVRAASLGSHTLPNPWTEFCSWRGSVTRLGWQAPHSSEFLLWDELSEMPLKSHGPGYDSRPLHLLILHPYTSGSILWETSWIKVTIPGRYPDCQPPMRPGCCYLEEFDKLNWSCDLFSTPGYRTCPT